MAKLLVIDDDFELATMIAYFLHKEMHQVEVITSGVEGLARATAEKFDALILDIGLPDLDGFTICQKLREMGNTALILMLSGKGQINDRVVGLDSGADDYMIKPFSGRELLARLRAILRRPQVLLENVLTVDDIRLDMVAHRVYKGDEQVDLMPTDYALFEFFMKNPNQVFSSEQLLTNIWIGETKPSDNAVRSAIKRLRQALDDGEHSDSIIETVKRVGYRLRQS